MKRQTRWITKGWSKTTVSFSAVYRIFCTRTNSGILNLDQRDDAEQADICQCQIPASCLKRRRLIFIAGTVVFCLGTGPSRRRQCRRPQTAIIMPLPILVSAAGLMYDVLAPHKVPGGACANKVCVPWSSLNRTIDSYWQAGAPVPGASNICAQLGNAPGLHQGDLDPQGLGGQGAFCFCDNGTTLGYCDSQATGIPEQINIQIAAPDVVVLAFVTFEGAAPTKPPRAKVGRSAGSMTLLPADPGAVTHTYVSPSKTRIYYMHFVTLRGLQPHGTYYYAVRSGGEGAAWSGTFSFRAGYADGAARIARIFEHQEEEEEEEDRPRCLGLR